MARSLNIEDIKRGDLLRVWPEDLIANQDNRGRAFSPSPEAIAAMADDIAARGQLQPVVCAITHDKRLRLDAGFTRYEAINLLNSRGGEKRRIEVKVIDANAEESFLGTIAENRMRNATTVVDDAHNVRRLSEQFHKSDAEICTLYGTPGKAMSQGWLDNLRKILRLDPDHQRRIHEGHLSATIGYLLADIAPEDRKEVLDGAGENPTTTDVLKSARKRGKLAKSTSLKAAEMRQAWEYLQEDKNPKVVKLAGAALKWQAGDLPEPDFFKTIHALF